MFVVRSIISLFFVFQVWTGGILLCQYQASVLGDKNYITLPFHYSQGFIIVDIVFGHVFPMKFILDTGAEHTILLQKEYAEILNYPYEKEIKVVGADISNILKAWVVRKVPLKFHEGQLIMKDIIVLDHDIMDLSAMTGYGIHGVLGVEFLKNYVVDINFAEMVIRLYRADYSREQWKKFDQIPLEVYQHKPYIRTLLSLSGKENMSKLLLVDTGAALSLLLHTDVDSLDNLPSRIVKGTIGKGVGGDLVGYSGKINRLTIGKTNFNNLITSFQSPDTLLIDNELVREGIVGNYILDQFRVIFDFPHNALKLKPRRKKPKPLEYDKTGLIIYAFGTDFKNYYVHDVMPGSPAEEVGIMKGDIVKRIGHWPANFYTLNGVNRRFSSNKKMITVTITQDGVDKKIELPLRDMYEPVH